MIPLSDGRTPLRVPAVNRVLLLINLAVWLYLVLGLRNDGPAVEAFYVRYSFDWNNFSAALAAGDLRPDLLITAATHMFVHAGWLHVLGNMLYLWIFGDNVEDQLGSARYLAFYLLCGLAAAVGQGLIAPAPMVGASGAVAGVLGAYLFLFPGARVRTLVFLGLFITIVRLPALIVIGLWIVVQVLAGLSELRVVQGSGAVAYFAHVAGFFAGIVLLFLLRPSRRGVR